MFSSACGFEVEPLVMASSVGVVLKYQTIGWNIVFPFAISKSPHQIATFDV